MVRKRPRTKSADDEDDSVFGVVVVDVNDHGLSWMRIAWGLLWVATGDIMSCRPCGLSLTRRLYNGCQYLSKTECHEFLRKSTFVNLMMVFASKLCVVPVPAIW